MQILARSCVREFVSLAQQEAGRSRTVSDAAAQGGYSSELDYRLSRVDEKMLLQLRRGVSR